jgi:hypothetical protein
MTTTFVPHFVFSACGKNKTPHPAKEKRRFVVVALGRR